MREARERVSAGVVAACSRGDRDAFRVLFETTSPRVHSIALHFFGGDGATAMDVTQQVYLKLLSRAGQFRGEADVCTWLHRITVNCCLDHQRARRPHVALEAVQDLASPAGHRQDTLALQGERERAVRRAVADLPPRLRLAVLLRHFEDLSYDDTARALGCSPGTVASRLSRAHARLAQTLGPRFSPEGAA